MRAQVVDPVALGIQKPKFRQINTDAFKYDELAHTYYSGEFLREFGKAKAILKIKDDEYVVIGVEDDKAWLIPVCKARKYEGKIHHDYNLHEPGYFFDVPSVGGYVITNWEYVTLNFKPKEEKPKNRYYNNIKFNDKEQDAWDAFVTKHLKKSKYTEFSYQVHTGSGIGLAITAIAERKGKVVEELDISDYDSW